MAEAMKKLDVPEVAKQIKIERKVLNLMDGGCQLPLGVYCENDDIYVAYAPGKNEPAKNFHFKNDESGEMAEKS